jgi:hypothetical protein
MIDEANQLLQSGYSKTEKLLCFPQKDSIAVKCFSEAA